MEPCKSMDAGTKSSHKTRDGLKQAVLLWSSMTLTHVAAGCWVTQQYLTEICQPISYHINHL